MENNANVSSAVIETINTIFGNIFSSIDMNLFKILDELTFIKSDILNDKYFGKIFGTSATNGILLVSNSLLIGFILYFAVKHMLSSPCSSSMSQKCSMIFVRFISLIKSLLLQFILKLIICGICMNGSYFIIGQVLDINSNISLLIRNIGEELFHQNICFSNLIENINTSLRITKESIDVFSIDGLIKGATTISMLNLVTEYALRYVMVKLFVLLSPFAILSLCLESSSWFFKVWYKNLFSLLFLQIIVSIILLILFSINYTDNDLMTKYIYIGGIYSLIRANTFVREFLMGSGISTNTPNTFNLSRK